jgi:ATP-dependent helicase HrpA
MAGDEERDLEERHRRCRRANAPPRRAVAMCWYFLPGEREIRDTAELLRRHANGYHAPGLEVVPLVCAAFRAWSRNAGVPARGHQGRRVVLATNVAETSLTVPGIRFVIDSGLARVKRYSLSQQGRAVAGGADRAGGGEPARRALRAGRRRGCASACTARLTSPNACRVLPSRRSCARRWPRVILRMKALRLGDDRGRSRSWKRRRRKA